MYDLSSPCRGKLADTVGGGYFEGAVLRRAEMTLNIPTFPKNNVAPLTMFSGLCRIIKAKDNAVAPYKGFEALC